MGDSDFHAVLRGAVAKHEHRYGSVLVRAALVRRADKWYVGMATALPLPATEIASPRAALIYDDVALVDARLTVEELVNWLLTARETERWALSGINVEFPEPTFYHDPRPQLGSNNEYSAWPVTVLKVAFRDTVVMPSGPLVAFGMPRQFANINEAIPDWLGLRDFHGYNDGRRFQVLCILPDYRLRIENVRLTRGKVRVAFEIADIGLSAECRYIATAGTRRFEGSQPLDDRVEFRVSGSLDSVRVYVVGPSETIDSYEQGPGHHSGHTRWIGGPEPKTKARLKEDLARGEGPTLEYKPWIEPGDPKERELAETAVAFANASGGDILLGVDGLTPVSPRHSSSSTLGTRGGRHGEAYRPGLGRPEAVYARV